MTPLAKKVSACSKRNLSFSIMGSLTDVDKNNIIEPTMDLLPEDACMAFEKHVEEQKKLLEEQ